MATRFGRSGIAVAALAAFAATIAGAGVLRSSDKLTDDEKIALVRDLTAEYAEVKETLPRSRKPLEFDVDGTHDKKEWQKIAQTAGTAARLGDKVQITRITLEGDRLLLEINGGLKDGKRFMDHVQIGMGTSTQPLSGADATAKLGTYIQVNFHKPMESLSSAEVKKILAPVLDFDKHSATQMYAETLPPEVKAAISEKRAIEGMDRDQVILALGHPDHKYRETKDGLDVEDWIFGTPPGKITFVTFGGTKVVRVKEEYAGLGLETSPQEIAIPR